MNPAKIFCLLFSLFLGGVAEGQYVRSALSNSGAPVLRDYVNPYAEAAMFPVVAVGKFTSATQIIDDIATIDASGSLSCILNNGDGTFSPPVVTNILPISLLPVTALRVASVIGSPDILWLASNAGTNGNAGTSTLTQLSFNGCVPTLTNRVFSQGPILYISDTSNSVFATFPLYTEKFPGASVVYGCCSTQFWPGPFTFPSASQYDGASVIVSKYDAQLSSFAPVTVAFTSSGARTNQVALEGEYFLGFIDTANGDLVAASSTNNQLFLDQISIVNQEPAITALGTYNLAGNPVGLKTGNFANDTENSDLAVAAGNEVIILSYVGTVGRPLWNYVDTLTASGSIGAIDTGSLVPHGSDIVLQMLDGNEEVFSTQAFTELAPPPTFTLSVSSSGPGTVSQTPTGTSFRSGTSVTLTAVPDAGASLSQWGGACVGAGTALTCDLVITADFVVTATFAAPAPAPTLTATPPTTSITAGNSANYSLTPSGFSATPVLSVSGCQNIQKATCQIVSGALVVSTTAPSTSATMHVDWRRIPRTGVLLAALCLFALLLPFPRRARLVLSAACFLVLVGCGGGGSKPPVAPQSIPGTPAGTYALQIQAVSGSATASTTVSLKVQ